MAEPRHLPRAPITEAVVELRVVGASGSIQGADAAFGDYRVEHKKEVQHSFTLGPSGPSVQVQDLGIRGVRLISPDGRNVAQVNDSALTYSRLAPYTVWEDLRSGTQQLWEIYRQLMQPQKVVRIGIRFLNRLDLPLPIADLRTFLAAPPELPPGALPQMNTFVTRIVSSVPDGSRMTAVSQAVVEAADPTRISVVLDIDASCHRSMDPADDRIWQEADHLRELKNAVFFGSITEETARMYE